MEEVHQICVNSPEAWIGLVSMVVTGVSTIVNFVPAPDKIGNPVLKFLSRVLHFIAVDIVTAKK